MLLNMAAPHIWAIAQTSMGEVAMGRMHGEAAFVTGE